MLRCAMTSLPLSIDAHSHWSVSDGVSKYAGHLRLTYQATACLSLVVELRHILSVCDICLRLRPRSVVGFFSYSMCMMEIHTTAHQILRERKKLSQVHLSACPKNH